MTRASLPKLPPRLYSATIAAADNLAAIASAEGITLVGERGEGLPHLHTILYTIRERCAQVWPQTSSSSSQMIQPAEVATVLETIAQLMVSEGLEELAGYNASWFRDAAGGVEWMVYGE